MNDISGQKFNRWTPMYAAPFVGNRPRWYVCRCDCGTVKLVDLHNLIKEKSTSCGCFLREWTAKKSTTHGATVNRKRTPEYKTWTGIKERCFNQNSKFWSDYGGRGITMCKEWNESFGVFLRDVGKRPEGMTLDRKDNDGNYEPGNVRWATRSQQANNRRSSRILTLNGESHTMTEWSRINGIKVQTIHKRKTLGWSDERALSVKTV